MPEIRPIAIKNIESSIYFHKKSGDIICIGNRQADRYIYVNTSQAEIILIFLKYIDGSHTLSDAQKLLKSKGYNVDISTLYNLCSKCGFIEFPKSNETRHKSKFEILTTDLAKFNLSKLKRIFSLISRYFYYIIISMILCDIM